MNAQKYFKDFLLLREDIRNKKATWEDVLKLRQKYQMPSVSKDQLRRGVVIFDEYLKNGWVSEPNNLSEDLGDSKIEILDNGNQISQKNIGLSEDQIKDPISLLKAHGYDPEIYELISAKNSKWQVLTKEGLKNLYSSKITVKPTVKIINEEFLRELENFTPPIFKNEKTFSVNSSKEDLIVCLFDVHFGRVSWEEETGEKYDLEIAEKRVIDNINKYKEKYKGRKFNKIIFVVGQDYFNSAANGYTSSNKHKQDNANVFRAIFKKGLNTLIKAITMLSEMAPVEVALVEGNHGRDEEYMLMQVIEAYFRNSKNIRVNSSSTPRKYFKLGNTTVGFSHGSEEKNRLYGLMQLEVPGYWATTENHLWLTGHLHSLKVESKNGVDVWSIPALTGNDSWTEKKGYKSKKCSMGFIFNEEEGLTDLCFINA